MVGIGRSGKPHRAGLAVSAEPGVTELAKEMVDDGYTDVCGIDSCESLISHLNGQELAPGLSYQVGNVHDLGRGEQFPAGSVDYLIDKALLDALLVSTLLHALNITLTPF